MRTLSAVLVAITAVAVATPSLALTRRSEHRPFYGRTAISGALGVGVAVGEFSSEKDGDGNQESGALDWSAEIEYFFAPRISFGASVSHTSYDDKDLGGALQTNVRLFGAFMRYVVPTRGPVYPFLRAGVGSMEVEFEDPVTRDESDHAGSVHLGGGALAMLGDHASLNASILYTFGFTDDARVGDAIVVDGETLLQVVGFDVQYWTFAAGISVYFP